MPAVDRARVRSDLVKRAKERKADKEAKEAKKKAAQEAQNNAPPLPPQPLPWSDDSGDDDKSSDHDEPEDCDDDDYEPGYVVANEQRDIIDVDGDIKDQLIGDVVMQDDVQELKSHDGADVPPPQPQPNIRVRSSRRRRAPGKDPNYIRSDMMLLGHSSSDASDHGFAKKRSKK